MSPEPTPSHAPTVGLCLLTVLLFASPLRLLWARAELGWGTPFVLWGILCAFTAALSIRGERS
ncbi:MAG: hypothetical protein AAGA56_12310 [Myxococcota bacterium]